MAEVGRGAYGDGYVFGAKSSGVGANMAGTDDFYLILSSSFNSFSYSVNGVFDGWVTRGVIAEYTETPLVAAVPEPGVLALFGLGLAGLGLSRRRHGRQA